MGAASTVGGFGCAAERLILIFIFIDVDATYVVTTGSCASACARGEGCILSSNTIDWTRLARAIDDWLLSRTGRSVSIRYTLADWWVYFSAPPDRHL